MSLARTKPTEIAERRSQTDPSNDHITCIHAVVKRPIYGSRAFVERQSSTGGRRIWAAEQVSTVAVDLSMSMSVTRAHGTGEHLVEGDDKMNEDLEELLGDVDDVDTVEYATAIVFMIEGAKTLGDEGFTGARDHILQAANIINETIEGVEEDIQNKLRDTVDGLLTG